MSVRRKAPSRTAQQPDSTEPQFDHEAAAEKKVLYVWGALLEIFGPRWTENNGNDPLGKYKNADNQQNPRKEQWIDELRFMSWPEIKASLYKLRRHPKPNDYWLPDLPTFIQLSGKGRAPATKQDDQLPAGSWVDEVCDKFSLVTMMRAVQARGPLSSASVALFVTATTLVRKQYNELLAAGELPVEQTTKEALEIRAVLARRFATLEIEVASPEEQKQAREAFLIRRGLMKLSHGKATLSSSTPNGLSIQDEPSIFE